VSAVTLRRPATISVRRLVGTSRSRASWVIDRFRAVISSPRISPGWIGGATRSMIVGDFDVISIPILEAEVYPPLLVDPNAVLAGSIPAEGLEPIGPHLHQILYTGGVGQHKKPSLCA
jgi:hypothetical protein